MMPPPAWVAAAHYQAGRSPGPPMADPRAPQPPTRKPAWPGAGRECRLHRPVTDYYRDTLNDYLTWSRQGYMHFGYWRRGLNLLHRQAMLEAMNDLVFESLRLDQFDHGWIGDLGCGLGAVSNYGSQRFTGHRWLAVTLSPEQVAFGRRRLSNDRVQLIEGDYHALPVADDSLEAAFFLESICHSPHLPAALAEACRVVKPGGRLVVVDGFLKKSTGQISAISRRLAGIVSHSWAVPQFPCVPEFERAVTASGWETEQRRELSWQIAPSVLHSPWLIIRHAARLWSQGRLTKWKRRHLIGCAMGILLGMQRRQFGYFIYTLRRPHPA